MTEPTEPTPIEVELAAMRKIATAFGPLDSDARDRVIQWAYDRFHAPLQSVMAEPISLESHRLSGVVRS